MPLIALGTDRKPTRRVRMRPAPSRSETVANLRRLAADIEKKMQIARVAANQIGKDVVLIRDSLGRLRMVFVEVVDAGERLASNVKGLDPDMGSEVNHIGGFRERGSRFGAWPAQGYAFPTRGYIAPMPRGYAIAYRTHPIPRSHV